MAVAAVQKGLVDTAVQTYQQEKRDVVSLNQPSIHEPFLDYHSTPAKRQQVRSTEGSADHSAPKYEDRLYSILICTRSLYFGTNWGTGRACKACHIIQSTGGGFAEAG